MRDLALALCALLAFLLPVAVYCLVLASINRRSRPLLVSGVWDSVGLLSAVSGFFLVTVPMLVAEFYLRAFAADGSGGLFGLWLQQWIFWLIYFLLLITGSTLMMLWRMHKTMIYNVDPEQFPKALERTFAAIGMGMALKNARLVLTPAPPAESADSTAISEVAVKRVADPNDSRYAELQVENFPSMCHVTLHWDNYTPEVRQQLEGELNKSLEAAAPLENPAAGWFLNIAGVIFGSFLMLALTVVILIILVKR